MSFSGQICLLGKSLFLKEHSKKGLSIVSTVHKSVAVRIPSVISAATVSILFVVLGLLRGLIRRWILDDVDWHVHPVKHSFVSREGLAPVTCYCKLNKKEEDHFSYFHLLRILVCEILDKRCIFIVVFNP